MATDPYALPNISTDPSYGSIISMLKSMQGIPSLQSTLVPQAQQILGQQSQYLLPQVEAIRGLTAEAVAGAQSDATKRGLTGSSIEAQNMGLARAKGAGTEADLRAQFGMASSNSFLNILNQAITGDQNAAMQLRVMLAQAMGDEMGAQRDLQMFRDQLSAGMAEASAANKTALWGAGLGAVGSIGSGLLAGRNK